MTERRLLKQPPDPNNQLSAIWREGVRAHCQHIFLSANPYKNGHESRKVWFDGWYDAWRILKWGSWPDEEDKMKSRFIHSVIRKGVRLG